MILQVYFKEMEVPINSQNSFSSKQLIPDLN